MKIQNLIRILSICLCCLTLYCLYEKFGTAVPNEINQMEIKIAYTINGFNSNISASLGITIPITLFKVIADRLNAPERNIETEKRGPLSGLTP